MRTAASRRVALGTAALGALVIAGAGWTMREGLLEFWYVRQLETGSGEELGHAVRRLGEMRSARAVPGLLRLLAVLREEHPPGVREALLAIGERGTAALSRGLHDGNPYVRGAAAEVLSSIGPPAARAVPDLIEARSDRSGDVRQAAAVALWMMGPAAAPHLTQEIRSGIALQEIIGALASARRGDQAPAAEATVSALGNDAIPPLIPFTEDRAVGKLVARAISGRGAVAVPYIVEKLAADPESVHAAWLLAIMPNEGHAAWRQALAKPATRRTAIRGAMKAGADAEALVPDLVAVLADRDVEAMALDALGRIGRGAARAVPAIVPRLKDPRPSVRYAAAFALGRFGPDAEAAADALISSLKDDNAGVRTGAASSLGQIGAGARAAIPALQEAARDEDRMLKAVAREAVSRIRCGGSTPDADDKMTRNRP